ncbi:MAG: hypothetical protein V4689_06465 [Verrucomicrobiota bacterium]
MERKQPRGANGKKILRKNASLGKSIESQLEAQSDIKTINSLSAGYNPYPTPKNG